MSSILQVCALLIESRHAMACRPCHCFRWRAKSRFFIFLNAFSSARHPTMKMPFFMPPGTDNNQSGSFSFINFLVTTITLGVLVQEIPDRDAITVHSTSKTSGTLGAGGSPKSHMLNAHRSHSRQAAHDVCMCVCVGGGRRH